MAKDSAIQWTTHSFNPWWGCLKVSPACDHCYAESFAKRVGQKVWGGNDSPRRFFGDKHWSEPLKWNKAADSAKRCCQKCGQNFEACWKREEASVPCPSCGGPSLIPRPRVFCASMSDVFEDREDLIPHRARLFELIAATPHLDWLLLTKRPQNWAKHLEEIDARMGGECTNPMIPHWLNGTPPANVWMGTTVENQKYAEKRIPQLLSIPARVRFLSCEPLLGPLDLEYPEGIWPNGPEGCCSGRECGCMGRPTDPPLIYGIDWIITGGESGPKARLSDPDWFRSLRDQCAAAGVAFFMKQLGGVRDARGNIDEFPEDLRIRQFPAGKEASRA